LKKIIIFALSLTSLELNATIDTNPIIEFSDTDFDERYALTSFSLTPDSYDNVKCEYTLWDDIPDFWITPYRNVNTLKIMTKKTYYEDQHLKFLPALFPYIKKLIIEASQIKKEKLLYLIDKLKVYIETLNLNGCNLGYNCEIITQCKKLKKLYICGNNISTLNFLTENITHLDISSNPLKKHEIINIHQKSPHLKELSVDKDILSPSDIKNLWLNLKELSCLTIGNKIYKK
jgi:Leucine-rich repeat (LRR) protein